jgi:hypothetical protein
MPVLAAAVGGLWLLLAASPPPEPFGRPDLPGAGCPTRVDVEEVFDKALTSPSQRETVLAALARLSALRAQVFSGGSAEGFYAGVPSKLRQAAQATDPTLAELSRRVAEDQFVRSTFLALINRQQWADGLSSDLLAVVSGPTAREMCLVDADNTRWIKEQIEARGWFKLSTAGEAAANDAFLLVQHADRDRPLQRQVLAIFEELLKTGEVLPRHYAYLYDRLAIADKRPQRYGTQGNCAADGSWRPFEVEALTELDARRREVGMMPEAEYIAGFSCPKPGPR